VSKITSKIIEEEDENLNNFIKKECQPNDFSIITNDINKSFICDAVNNVNIYQISKKKN